MFARRRSGSWRPARHRPAGRLAAALLIAAAAIQAQPAAAQSATNQSADPSRLQELETQIGSALERRKRLDAEAAALAREVEQIRTRLIETASRVQAREREVSDSEERLDGLIAAESVVAARLEKRHGDLIDTLAALQRIGRQPPPPLAVTPHDAVAAVRSALLLGAVAPELEADARELRDRLDELRLLREGIESERHTLTTASLSLSEEQAALRDLLERKLAAQSDLTQQAETEQKTLARLSREAGSLQELIARLEARAASRLPVTRPDSPLAAAPDPAPGTAPLPRPSPSARMAALTPPAALPPAGRRFSQARGLLQPPVEGQVVRHFGDPDGLGDKSRGLSIETRPEAQITAPFDGRVVFAGPFRRYGQLLIISVGEGYHVLLAGMARISGIVGQNLLAGEPVGIMPSAPSEGGTDGRGTPTGRGAQKRPRPALYIEFRRKGEPIDPHPWLVASDRKARG